MLTENFWLCLEMDDHRNQCHTAPAKTVVQFLSGSEAYDSVDDCCSKDRGDAVDYRDNHSILLTVVTEEGEKSCMPWQLWTMQSVPFHMRSFISATFIRQ